MAVSTPFSNLLFLIGLHVILSTFSTQTSALRTAVQLPSPRLLRLNITVAEPQPLRCYSEEESGFPVNREVCSALLRDMFNQRNAARLFTVKGTEVPIRYDTFGTPCVISLRSRLPSDEDRFTVREIAHRAVVILQECADEMFGGMAVLGGNGFFVRVDSGLELKLAGGRGNSTDVKSHRN